MDVGGGEVGKGSGNVVGGIHDHSPNTDKRRPTSRRKASGPAAAKESEAQDLEFDGSEDGRGCGYVGGGNALQFKKPLNWRTGKAIAVAESLRRLKNLFKELRRLQQEDVDKDSVKTKQGKGSRSGSVGDAGTVGYGMSILYAADMLDVLHDLRLAGWYLETFGLLDFSSADVALIIEKQVLRRCNLGSEKCHLS
ncbi:unnamed protein product [Zymoseptoria tritici ST99CH_1E4]|uniref:Uncharacterized protein n=1 Tax=Zymoseptoria tritici ST99CH_1E4 TaxID=1276532 RepID=A0A2H1H9B8_ZYMTR|nr:unnamed protein product [Zymoseptoria tritici ST99CH_1E4]